MSKLLISSDPGLQAFYEGAYDRMKADVQAVLDLYTPLGLPALVNSELSLFFKDISTLVFNKMTGGGIATLVFGEGEDAVPLPVNTTLAKNLIQYPSGYFALQEAIKALVAKAHNHNYGMAGSYITFRTETITSFFKIDEAGDLQFSDKVQNIIDDIGNLYVETDNGKAVYNFIKEVVEAYYSNDIPTITQKDLPMIITDYLKDVGTSAETFECSKDLELFDRRFRPIVE